MYISKFLIKSRRTIVNLLNSMVYNKMYLGYMQNTYPVQGHMTETAEKLIFLMFSCEMVGTLSLDLVTIKA